MFKISPIQSVDLQVKYAKECNAAYKENSFAYAMTDIDTGELMGFSQFEINEHGGLLLDLRSAPKYKDDYEAIFILGRATMNFIDLCGAHTLTAKESAADPTLLRAIGLRKTESGDYFCNMTGFFDGSHCSGHNE